MDPRSAARCEAGGQRRILPPRIFPRQLAPPPGRGAGPRGRRGRRPPGGVTATGHHPSSPAVPGRNLAVDRPSPQPGSTGSSRRSGLPGPWSAPDHAQGCARSPRPGSTGPSPARQLLSVRSTGQLAPQASQAGGLHCATGGPGRAYPIGGPESRLPHLAPGAAPARNDQPRSRLPLGGSWGLRLLPPVSPPFDHSPRPGSTGSSPPSGNLPMSDRWVNWLLRPGGHATGTLGPRPRALARPRHRPASTGSGASTARVNGSYRLDATPMSPGSLNWLLGLHARRSRANNCPGTPSYPPPTPRRCRVG
jgi:translation initiation factor IF-2